MRGKGAWEGLEEREGEGEKEREGKFESPVQILHTPLSSVINVNLKLENVHWSSVPVQIGDPIAAPPGEYVCKNIGIQVSPLLIPWQRKTFGRGQLGNGTSLSKSHLRKAHL